MTGTTTSGVSTVYHRTAKIDDLDIFYREAGDPSNPTILLLHAGRGRDGADPAPGGALREAGGGAPPPHDGQT